MDTRTGEIYTPEQMKLIEELAEKKALYKTLTEKLEAMGAKDLLSHLKQVNIPLTETQIKNMKIEPYDPCPCGSGNKFKFCCNGKENDYNKAMAKLIKN
jgi:uncharacterized protein YecA (UPF0149 family)